MNDQKKEDNWNRDLLNLMRDPATQQIFANVIELLGNIICCLPPSNYGNLVNLITLTIEMLRTVQKTAFRIACSRRTQL